jgi:hypothetical protein
MVMMIMMMMMHSVVISPTLLDLKPEVCSHYLAVDPVERMVHMSVSLIMWLNERSGVKGYEHQFSSGMEKFQALGD